jgi:hypothetical protein
MAKKNTGTKVKKTSTSTKNTMTTRTIVRSAETGRYVAAGSKISESDMLTLRAWEHTYATHGEGKS